MNTSCALHLASGTDLGIWHRNAEKSALSSHQRDWDFALLLQGVANGVWWMQGSFYPAGDPPGCSISPSHSLPPVARIYILRCIYSIKLGMLIEAPEKDGRGWLQLPSKNCPGFHLHLFCFTHLWGNSTEDCGQKPIHEPQVGCVTLHHIAAGKLLHFPTFNTLFLKSFKPQLICDACNQVASRWWMAGWRAADNN